jgi:hypothetical protein
MTAHIGSARLELHVDVWFGAVTTSDRRGELPTMLGTAWRAPGQSRRDTPALPALARGFVERFALCSWQTP